LRRLHHTDHGAGRHSQKEKAPLEGDYQRGFPFARGNKL
jgi:hypothetical protein